MKSPTLYVITCGGEFSRETDATGFEKRLAPAHDKLVVTAHDALPCMDGMAVLHVRLVICAHQLLMLYDEQNEFDTLERTQRPIVCGTFPEIRERL